MTSLEKTIETPMAGIPWRTIKMVRGNGFKEFAEREGYHALDIEDCNHKRQLGKVVERDDYVFVVAKVARYDAKTNRLYFDDFDMFIKPDSLVSVEEYPSDLVLRVCERFPQHAGAKPIDMADLVYAILDEIIDYYFVVLDSIGENIHSVETNVWKNPTPEMLERIFSSRRSLIDFRRNAGGMREVVSVLIRHPRVKTDSGLESYYRDLYEHTIRIIEFIETYRDVLGGSLDIYLSAVAQRTNEISKVLAVYGSIALPFLVITGMYGMNIPLPFQSSPHAFIIVLVSMSALATVAIFYFRRKEWF